MSVEYRGMGAVGWYEMVGQRQNKNRVQDQLEKTEEEVR